MWSADASNYRGCRSASSSPRDAADVEAALAVCREHDVPVLPRGAGTSIAGQAVNTAVVLDFTRYMNKVARDRPRRAHRRGCSPGVICDAAARRRRAARAHVRPRPVHAQPLHARRDDRQQRVRLALGGVGQDRRQRARARRAHLPRRAARHSARAPAGDDPAHALRRPARADRRPRPRGVPGPHPPRLGLQPRPAAARERVRPGQGARRHRGHAARRDARGHRPARRVAARPRAGRARLPGRLHRRRPRHGGPRARAADDRGHGRRADRGAARATTRSRRRRGRCRRRRRLALRRDRRRDPGRGARPPRRPSSPR